MTTCAERIDFRRESVTDADLEAFQRVRARLFGIAYRMLGRAVDADDVVQDTWLRWQTTDRDQVRDAAAFLATVTTRLALNVAESAAVRHERCRDPLCLNPVDSAGDPAREAEQGAALELAAAILLERLTASERAAYVLREAFAYPHRQIAELLGLSEVNTRQLVARARVHVAGDRLRLYPAADHRRLCHALVAAAKGGDVAHLERVLAADVSRRAPTPVPAMREHASLTVSSVSARPSRNPHPRGHSRHPVVRASANTKERLKT